MPNSQEVKRMMNYRGLYDPRQHIAPPPQDFIGDSGDTVPTPWAIAAKTDAGADTADYVDNTTNGEAQLNHGSTSGASELAITWDDHLGINLSQSPTIEIYAKIAFASGGVLGSADQRAVFGVGTAYASTLDDVTTNAWFRIDGNNADILIESDDGTTDTDDQDTDIDLADDTWTRFVIDFHDLNVVKFYVDGNAAGTTSMSDLSADTLVQPFIAIQRDAGSEQEDLRVDYVRFDQVRA